jgi:hypothetical protein
MSDVVTFRGLTISVDSIPVGSNCWSASYTVRDRAAVIQRSSDIPFQNCPQLAKSAAFIVAIQYVEDRLKRTH